MSTKTRISVTLSNELLDELRKRALEQCRQSLSGQIEWELKSRLLATDVKTPFVKPTEIVDDID
jgi:metal-responsive CopG/Arc/MetJ family transcriptional regulator